MIAGLAGYESPLTHSQPPSKSRWNPRAEAADRGRKPREVETLRYGLGATETLLLPDTGWHRAKTALEVRSHRPFKPLGVTELQPGKRDHLLELVAVAVDPGQDRERLLRRAMADVQHGATQDGHPKNMLGALLMRGRRGNVEVTFQGCCVAPGHANRVTPYCNNKFPKSG